MSSSYTPLVRFPKLVDENPTSLTIRKPESAEANDERSLSAKANDDRSLFGANASECCFESSQASLGCANPGKNFGLEHSEPVASLERSRILDVAATAEGIGTQGAEDVEIDGTVEKGGLESRTRSYGGGTGAGGKFRFLNGGNRRTPYERPVAGRHATAGGSLKVVGAASLPYSKKLNIASWLRDSTTRIIHSSASILFSTVFKRSSPSIEENGKSQGESITKKQEMSEGMLDPPAKQNGHIVLASRLPPLMDADVTPVEAENSVLDISKIEEILKQKTWSRDQVNRLTQILQEHMSETGEAKKFVETEKVLEQPVVYTLDTSPIQVARSYMGEQVTRLSGLSAAFLSSQAQSSPESTLAEDRYASSPFSRGWAAASTSVRIPKRSLAIEDDRSLMGPIRRVRQKTSLLATAGPYLYSRRMTGLNKPSETQLSSPPSQSSQTAKKILETLEKLSPSPQGKLLGAMTEKSVNGSYVLDKFSPHHKGKSISDIAGVAMIGASKHTAQISRAMDNIVLQTLSLAASPKSAEAKVNGKPSFKHVNFSDAELKKPVFETPPFMPQTCNFSTLSEGFQMNAVFEETMTDEEAKSHTKPQLSSAVKDQVAFSKEEANLAPGSSFLPFSKANGSASFAIALSEPVQEPSSSLASCFMINLSTPRHVAGATNEPTTNLSSLSSISDPAVTMETRPSLSDAAVSSSAALTIFFSEKKGLKVSNMTTVESATSDGSTAASEPTSTSVITSVSPSACTSTALPVLFFAGTGNGVSGGSSPVLPTPNTHFDPFRSEKATVTSLINNYGEGGTMATELVLEEPDISGSSGTLLSVSAFLVEDGSGKESAGASVSSLASASPFGAQSSPTFAPKPLSGASPSLPSVSAFVCGGQSSILSIGEPPTAASGASVSLLSGSSFAFGTQSGTVTTGQEPNLAAWSIFGQSGTSSTGQTSCFTASPSSLASNPFQSTAGNSSSLLFGSSHAAVNNPFLSTVGSLSSSVFGSSHAAVSASTLAWSSLSSDSTSSAPSFGGSSSMRQFGAPAFASSLVSGPAAYSSTERPFATSLFSFSPSLAASGSSTFSVFGAVPSSTTAGSASPTTQMFAFGATEPNPFTANAFSSSGTDITPFNTGATPSFSTATSGSYGSRTSLNVPHVLAFGSASTSNPSPFTFGSGQLSKPQASIQTPSTFETLSNNDQPFGFTGVQSAATVQAPTPAPAPNPSLTAGTAQLSLGFALGATGGDKSARKFVKVKRIGGTKKGK